jgi:hypothetical protein
MRIQESSKLPTRLRAPTTVLRPADALTNPKTQQTAPVIPGKGTAATVSTARTRVVQTVSTVRRRVHKGEQVVERGASPKEIQVQPKKVDSTLQKGVVQSQRQRVVAHASTKIRVGQKTGDVAGSTVGTSTVKPQQTQTRRVFAQPPTKLPANKGVDEEAGGVNDEEAVDKTKTTERPAEEADGNDDGLSCAKATIIAGATTVANAKEKGPANEEQLWLAVP